jgi:hypothetical protein
MLGDSGAAVWFSLDMEVVEVRRRSAPVQ